MIRIISHSDKRRSGVSTPAGKEFMNVVIAIDSFKGSMTSMQAGLSAAAGIKRVYKNASVTVRPLADGGEGTVDALVNGCGDV